MIRTLLHIAASLLMMIWTAAPITRAEEPAVRPVTVSYMAGGGTAHVADAYLSPFPTAGWGTALILLSTPTEDSSPSSAF